MKIRIIIILAIFYSLWINQWGYTWLWKIASYLNILIIVATYIFNTRLGFKIFFYSIFLISEFSRSLFGFQSLTTEISEYYNIHTVSLAGFSGSLMTLILIFIISIVKTRGIIPRVNKTTILTISVIFLIFLSTVLQIIISNGSSISSKYLISDTKPFIALAIGLYFGLVNSLYKKPLLSLNDIRNLGIILGLKSIFLITSDILLKDKILLEFNNQPYIVFPVVFTSILFNKKNRFIEPLILLFGAFTISRSIILFTTLAYFYSIKFFYQNYKKGLKLLFSIPLLVILCLVIGIVRIPEEVVNFFMFKLEFFTKELISGNLSASPGIRVYEFLNITRDMFDDIKVFLIGKGFGGYFEFHSNIQPLEIAEFDYSADQIMANKFYKPHTFINYTLLKGGITYLSFYIMMIYKLYIKGKKYSKENRLDLGLFLILFSFFAPNFFWKFEYMFLFGLMITFDFKYEKENINNRTSFLQKA